jgi:branched-subunit amino acid permease
MLQSTFPIVFALLYVLFLCWLCIKHPKKFDNIATILGAIVLALVIIFVAYGVNSQCPNEAVYRYCAPADRGYI